MATTHTTGSTLDLRTVRWLRVRVLLLGFAFVPMFAALLYRAVSLQVVQGAQLRSLARNQSLREITVRGRRGEILDRRGDALAASVEADSIYVDPSSLPDARDAARRIGRAVGVDPKKLEPLLSADRQFAWVKRHATPQEVAAVKELGLPGLGYVKEPRRFYPQRELAAHVLGFSGVDGEGLEGLERQLDEMLRGKPQVVANLRDARGRAALLEGSASTEALAGATVRLTIDRAIQYQTEKALQAAVTAAEAAAGVSVVLDPTTGEILALANVPTFNPNNPGRYQHHALRNRAVTDQFEPGSTFKVFTVAAALEERVVGLREPIFCENGRYPIGRHAIHDHGRNAWLDVGRIVQVSSNIGTAKIAEKLGREKLQAYFKAFGFGERPGTQLPGEARGSLPFPRSDIALATQSFGQGLTATPLQIAAAYAAIANGGTLMRPYLVSEVVDAEGAVLLKQEPQRVGQVVSGKTAKTVIDMMQLVVQKEGTAPRARMDEYLVAGKTGTAQKADPVTGGYSADKRTASFAGIVPADAPRLVILVIIDEPKTDVYGGVVAAPAFKEIAQAALAHLGVPPSAGAAVAEVAVPDPSVERRSRLAGAFASAASPPPAPAPGEGCVQEDEDVSGDRTKVPDLHGMTARAVVAALSSVQLEPVLQGSGRAVGQRPSAGASVPPGTQVTGRLE